MADGHQVFCPKCHKAVAPFDPERVQIGLYVYHHPCLKQAEVEKQQDIARYHDAGIWPDVPTMRDYLATGRVN